MTKLKTKKILKHQFLKIFKEFVKVFKYQTLWQVPKEFTFKVSYKKSKKRIEKLNKVVEQVSNKVT